MSELFAGEGRYVALLLAVFVVPRVLQRFRIPAAITAFALGGLAGPGLGWFTHDSTVSLLSTLGIVTLFLFAGLEVELHELAERRWTLLEHVAIRAASIAVVAVLGTEWAGLHPRVAVIVGLALLTPSTGFILESLASLPVGEAQKFWIRSKAISSELFALAAMFIVLQSESASRFGVSSAVLLLLILVVPLVVRAFAKLVVPYAPKSEFAFLVILAVTSAMVTRKLGVYYLVGAFVVGIAAQRLRERLPAMASERMLHAVEAVASLFVPFYFFHAGSELRRGDLGWDALRVGAVFLLVFVPARIFSVNLHRRVRLKEQLRASSEVSVSLLPTFVFTLVLAAILRDRYDVPAPLFGGLIIYAVGNTLIPSLVFKAPVPTFESPAVPMLEPATEEKPD